MYVYDIYIYIYIYIYILYYIVFMLIVDIFLLCWPIEIVSICRFSIQVDGCESHVHRGGLCWQDGRRCLSGVQKTCGSVLSTNGTRNPYSKGVFENVPAQEMCLVHFS